MFNFLLVLGKLNSLPLQYLSSIVPVTIYLLNVFNVLIQFLPFYLLRDSLKINFKTNFRLHRQIIEKKATGGIVREFISCVSTQLQESCCSWMNIAFYEKYIQQQTLISILTEIYMNDKTIGDSQLSGQYIRIKHLKQQKIKIFLKR